MLRSAVRGWNHKYTKKYSLRVGTINTQRHIHRVMGWDQIVKYPPKGIVKPVLDQCVKIRTASLSDYNSVVSIIQNGEKKTFDHLADKYCAYISSPTSTGYIANINGEDVSQFYAVNHSHSSIYMKGILHGSLQVCVVLRSIIQHTIQ